ncbi:MAG: hypothetical protein U1E59_03210 [Amaricoccus sp.]
MSFLSTIEAAGPLPPRAGLAGRPLVFLDFEASSLSPGSWPIEIGWAWVEDGAVQAGSTLIAPRPDWSLADWWPEAERVHGIPLAEVQAVGMPAEAAAAMTDVFADCDLVSDNPVWEQRWLNRLRAGRAPVEVKPLRRAMLARMHPYEADWFRCALLRANPSHRAGDDARAVAAAWLAATRGDILAR